MSYKIDMNSYYEITINVFTRCDNKWKAFEDMYME